MKLNSTKKLALALGSIGSIVAPIATIVSCGGGYEGRFDQANDGIIKVMSAFAVGGAQEKAFQVQLDEYNKTQAKKPGFKKVEIQHIEGGYNAEADTLVTKFEAKDTKTLPNLIIGYADTLGSISKYDMELNLEKKSGTKIRNAFEKQFMAENDNIGGLDGSKGTYLIPLAKSTDVLNVNKQLIGFLANEINAAKTTQVTIEPTSELGKMSALSTKSTDEVAYIKKQWGEIDTKAQKIIDGIDLSDDIFSSYEGLINFATKVQSVFPKTKTNKELHVLGVDSSATFMYEIAYSILGTKDLDQPNSFLFTKEHKNDGANNFVNHDFMDKNSAAGKAFAKAYAMMQPALENGALYFNDKGAYASQYETKHEIGMALSSTAGYSHNYLPGDITKFYKGTTEIDHTDVLDSSSAKDDLIGVFSSYSNKVFKSTGKAGKYDAKLPDANADKTVQGWIDSNKKIGISSNSDASTIAGAIKVSEGAYPKYIFAVDGKIITSKLVKSSDTLQKAELEIMTDPGKLNSKQKQRFIFSQGPSLIGLHSNDVEDEATRNFIEWLTSSTTTATSSHDTVGANEKPITRFNKDADYIGVETGAFKNSNPGKNDATKMAWDNFKDAIDDKDVKIFTNPVDDSTSSLRKNIQAALNQQYLKRANANGATTSTDSLATLYGMIGA